MLFLKTPQEIALIIAQRVKNCRLDARLTQTGLAARAGISLSSLKRFEYTGQIAFESLIKIGLALNALNSFEKLFDQRNTQISIDEILKKKSRPKRGRIK